MNKRITVLMLVLMLILSAAAMSACGRSSDDSDSFDEDFSEGGTELEYLDYEDDNDFDQPKYDSEGDGAEVVKENHDVEDFIGMWKATSNRSAYMYGNVDITIKDNGKWKGNITEEDFSGKWTYDDGEVVIKDSEGIIDFTLFFNSDGYLMFKNNEVPEDAYVLEKHEG